MVGVAWILTALTFRAGGLLEVLDENVDVAQCGLGSWDLGSGSFAGYFRQEQRLGPCAVLHLTMLESDGKSIGNHCFDNVLGM